jgi:hypothetical protein
MWLRWLELASATIGTDKLIAAAQPAGDFYHEKHHSDFARGGSDWHSFDCQRLCYAV